MINREKLEKEIERLQDWLEDHDPATDGYAFVQERLTKLVKLSLEIDDAHNREVERHDEYELKIDKLKLEYEEAQRKWRAEIRQILWELVKMGFSSVLTFLLILGTGFIEQNVILGQHKFGFIQNFTKTKF